MSVQTESDQLRTENHNRIVNTLKYYDENDINTLTKMNLELGEPITVSSLKNFIINLQLEVDLFMYKIIETQFEVDNITSDWYDKSLKDIPITNSSLISTNKKSKSYEHKNITHNKIKKLIVEKFEPVLTPYLLELMNNMRSWEEDDPRLKLSQEALHELATYNLKFKNPTKISNKYIKDLTCYNRY